MTDADVQIRERVHQILAERSPILFNYTTGEAIRPATEDEERLSKAWADRDGGIGVISVVIDGLPTACYVL